MDLEKLKELTSDTNMSANKNGDFTFMQVNEASSLVIATLSEYYQERIPDFIAPRPTEFMKMVLNVCMVIVD